MNDAQLAGLGMNCVRIPFHYRHFEDDESPMRLKEAGFRLLDRAVGLCSRHCMYTVLDLHAAPGFQNQRWHSDNPTGIGVDEAEALADCFALDGRERRLPLIEPLREHL